MAIFQATDQVDAINEVVKLVVYFHRTLDQKKDDLEDALEDIERFYGDDSEVDQKAYDLEGNEITIKVIKPLSRKYQDDFKHAISVLATQTESVFVVANDMKKQLHQLGNDRIMANAQQSQPKPTEEGTMDKIKNVIMSNPIKKEKQYATLNEADDPFKLSINTVQAIENFVNNFDRFVEFHSSYGIEIAEETDISGQVGALNMIVNIFNTRIKPRLLRLIEASNRIQREAERNEAVKALLEAKTQADRTRNAQLGMMMPQQPTQ